MKLPKAIFALLFMCSILGLLPVEPVSADPDTVLVDDGIETVVVTATRREQTVYEVTGAVSVVSQEDVLRRAPDMLAEMMRGLPGAFFQQTTPGQGIPIIRGLKGSQILHLVDGMRLNNAFFRNAPNQYLGLVDSFAIERTEIVRGAAPSLYGADAMGGVLQVLSAEPNFDDPDWRSSGRFYGSYNSVDSSFIGRASAAAGREGSTFSGGVSYHSHGDRKTGGGETVTPTAYRVRAADFKYRQSVFDDAELMLSLQYLEQPSSPRVDELIPGFGQDEPSSSRYEFMPNEREFIHLRYRQHSESGWFEEFEAHIARQVIIDDRLTQDFGSTEETREANKSTLDGLTLQFITPLGKNQANALSLTWGAEFYTDTIDSSRVRTDTVNGQSRQVRSRFPNGSSMDSAAVYASSHWAWSRFDLDAGFRYSWFDIQLPAASEVGAVRLQPNDLTGDVHAGFTLTEGLRLLANIGRGFRPPNIFDLGTLGSRPGNRFNVPNPDLNPESVWSYDLGLKLSRGRWQAELYAWYADYQDKISSRFTGEVTPEGRQVVTSDNLNSARLYGLESGVRYIASDSTEWYATLNYTRGDEDSPGEETVAADRIPPLNGRLGAIWNSGDWRLESWLDFASRQDRLSPRDESDPRIDPTGTDGWVTANALVSLQVNPAAELGLRLLNLGDRRYREHGSGLDAPGRNIGLWMNYAF